MSQTGTLYTNDVGSVVAIQCAAPTTASGANVTSARVFARRGTAAQVELAVTIASQSASSVTLQHVTTGNLTAGTYTLRAWLFAGSGILWASKAGSLEVRSSALTPPTAPAP